MSGPYQPPQPPTRPPSSPSDPFTAPRLTVKTTGPFKRPASLTLPPPAFGAPPTRAYNPGADFSFGPPSPAPFVGYGAGSDQWPGRGPQVPASPFAPMGSPFPSLLDVARNVQPGPSSAGSSSRLDERMDEDDDEDDDDADEADAMAIDHLSPRRSVGLSSPLAPLSTSPTFSAAPRISPFPGSEKRPSLSRQLFGKAAGLPTRDLSPAGFPFPITPPLTPPSSALPLPLSYHDATPKLQAISTLPTPPPSVPSREPSVTEDEADETTVSARLLAQHQLHPRFAHQYTILGELGSGGFGFVVRAIRNADKRVVAVKFIFRDKVPSHGWVRISNWDGGAAAGRMEQERTIPMEAYVLRNCRHDGIVGFIDLFESDKYFYLVMEHHGSPWQAASDKDKPNNLTSPSSLPALAAAAAKSKSFATGSALTSSPPSLSPISSPTQSHLLVPPSAGAAYDIGKGPSGAGGRPAPMLRRASCDLFECIEQHTRLPEDQARHIFAQIVDVVHYLHSRGISHRDIKDENIVIDKQFRVKLIDFGSAVLYDPRQEPPYYNRFWGTMNFASAEILAGKPYQAPPAEVWALGVLLHILLCGETPFADPQRAMAGRISNLPNRPKLSVQCHDLILRCLHPDPAHRATINEVRAHPWLGPAMRGASMGRCASTA